MTDNRENWLNKFTKASSRHFVKAGFPLPGKVRCSIGFTSKGMKAKRIGECWSDLSSKDKTFEIFIVPTIDDSSRIADILTHELVHAAVGHDKKHGKVFKKCATTLGLTGKMTATEAGPDWHVWADPILEKLGPMPHAGLTDMKAPPRPPSDSANRHIKCECTCGVIFRTSRKVLSNIVDLRCPNADCDGAVSADRGEEPDDGGDND